MTQTDRSKSELLIEALGQYLDGLDGTAKAAGSSPAVAQQLAEVDERLMAIEEILLEEYMEPEPPYVRRLRPMRTGGCWLAAIGNSAKKSGSLSLLLLKLE